MRITAILPAHNEEKNIGRTIKSLLTQSYEVEEIIVVADNCSDRTVEIAEEYRVTVFETVNNKFKKAGALNQVLKNVTLNEFILIADADTILDRDAIKEGVKSLRKNRKLGAVCSKAGVVENRHKGIKNSLVHSIQKIEYAGFDSHRVETQGNIKVLQGMCTLFRREVLEEVGAKRGEVFLENSLVEDYELTLYLKENGWQVSSQLKMKAYTEVPLKIKDLYVQRQRWLRGGVDALRLHGWNKTTRVEILNHFLFILLVSLRLLAVSFTIIYLLNNGFNGFNKLVLFVLGIAFIDSVYRLKYVENIKILDIALKLIWIPGIIYGWFQAFILLKSYYLSFTNKSQNW